MRVIRDVLKPRGFCAKGTTMLNRVAGDQLHGIEFQASQYGGEFTVNLGFHYAWIPSVYVHAARQWADFTKNDYAVYGDLGTLTVGRHTWWRFDPSPEVYEHHLVVTSNAACDVLDRQSVTWNDPGWFLARMPPAMVGAVLDDPQWHVPRPAHVLLVEGWRFISAGSMAHFLAHIALHLGDSALAKAYAEAGISHTRIVHLKSELADFIMRNDLQVG